MKFPIVTAIDTSIKCNTSMKQSIEDKGYTRVEVTIFTRDRDSYGPATLIIERHDTCGNRLETEYLKGETGEELIERWFEWKNNLESADLVERKSLISRLDELSSEMESAGFEGAKALLDGIMEPMRTNLLEDKS